MSCSRVTWLAALISCHSFTLAGEVKIDARSFVIPDGFIIEKVAGPPLADRPIVADFDERGRLFVADSSGSNDKVEKQLAEKPHRIVCLEDKDRDGRFETSTVFADKMMFPEGVLCYDGSVFVAAPPSIWKLTDTDGDGKCDNREEWFQGKTLTGCANDLHGPYLGPDGWIYWCKGAFAEQTYKRPGKPDLVTKAAHVFRCRPDGSKLEPVITGGMDNPVEIAWSKTGELFFTSTFVQHPGGGKRDAIVHGIYGGLYGKDHHVIENFSRTGDLMPIMTHLGPAAPSGLMRYESTSFGTDYSDNLFAALFNMHKVTRHVLVPTGSTFTTKDSDFVVSPDIDFHPTDVLEDADGSILIIDTGGWYKLCCPTSQLWKPDVLGAIYRVRRKDSAKVDDPWGMKIAADKSDIETWASHLDDDRFMVRKRARLGLIQSGKAALDHIERRLHPSEPHRQRIEALWTLSGIDDPKAREIISRFIGDKDPEVSTIASRVAGLWQDKKAADKLASVVTDSRRPLHPRRAMVEALGRCESSIGSEAIKTVGKEKHDRVWRHVVAHAMDEIEVNNIPPEFIGIGPGGYITALKLMAPGKSAIELLGHGVDPEIRRLALHEIVRNPKMVGSCASYFKRRFSSESTPSFTQEESQFAVRFSSKNDPISSEVIACLGNGLLMPNATVRDFVLDVMARRNPANLPEAWIEPLLKSLSQPDANIPAICRVFKSLKAPKVSAEKIRSGLLEVTHKDNQPLSSRLLALASIPGATIEPTNELFSQLLEGLRPDQPMEVRSAAIDAASKCRLNTKQWLEITATLRQSSPLDIDRMLNIFTGVTDEHVGRALVASLKESKARRALREETLRPRLQPFGAKVMKEAESLFALVREDQKAQLERLEAMEKTLPKGDIRRGLAVFHSTKANCAGCHQMGYLGGNLGPDLNRIGSIRTKRDLLESIVFPSVSFVRSYEPTAVVMQDGRTLNGLLKRDAPDEIELATGPMETLRLPRADIEAIKPSPVSIMPAGLEQQLTMQDVADLLEFLQSAK